MERPTFSIITPSFNQSDWLRLCVASVADQAVPHEHVIQDAGSTDGTLSWVKQDGRVEVHVEKDAGMYDGINRGLKRARGEILAYLNCDEQYLPGALEMVGRCFRERPGLDVLFADAVVVDPGGHYLWHRKSLVPQLWHTEMFPLSILTCATFFRRRLVEDLGLFFDPSHRFCGDSVWVRALIRAGVRMEVLRAFTSVFTHTGDNLSLRPEVKAEAEAYFGQVPSWRRLFRPAVLAQHRLRRWWGGVYRQKPFRFALYTRDQPDVRQERGVPRPTFRWAW